MKTTNWLVLGLAVILVLCIGLALGAGLLGYGVPGGMMGRWGGYNYPGGMMGGWGWGLGGLLVMGLLALVPIGFLVLLVLGIVWLVKAVSVPTAQPPISSAVCPACHRSVQSDWQVCPQCGQKLQ